MSHKVHPKSFRIRKMEDWSIRGFYGDKMPQLLEEDVLIKQFLTKKLHEASVAGIEIERSANRVNIIIETARPGIIIGRGGEGAENLKNEIQKKLAELNRRRKRPSDLKREIKIEIREVKNPWLSSAIVGQMVAQQIEKRTPFRQVMKRTISRIMENKEAKGVRIELSGRLNGVEISRKEWLKEGRLPRNTIRADIDFSQAEALCTYGKIGVKVWIYKGEKFD